MNTFVLAWPGPTLGYLALKLSNIRARDKLPKQPSQTLTSLIQGLLYILGHDHIHQDWLFFENWKCALPLQLLMDSMTMPLSVDSLKKYYPKVGFRKRYHPPNLTQTNLTYVFIKLSPKEHSLKDFRFLSHALKQLGSGYFLHWFFL